MTLHWPEKIETEGFATRKLEAERRAAAAACHRLKVSDKLSFFFIFYVPVEDLCVLYVSFESASTNAEPRRFATLVNDD